MNEQKEISINFKDYMLYSLHRWRLMIILAVLFGCIAGGCYFGYKNSKWNEVTDSYDAELENYYAELEEYNNTKEAYEAELNYEIMRRDAVIEYISNSLYYGLNPDRTVVTMADIYLYPNSDEEKEKVTSNVDLNTCLTLYADLMTYGIDWQEVGDIININERYVREIVDISVDYDARLIRVRVIYPDVSSASSMMKKIFELVEKKKTDLTELDGYTIEIRNVCSYEDTIPEMDEDRTDINNKVATFENGIKAIEKNLDSLKEPTMPEMKSKKSLLMVSLILAILGAALGVALVFIMCYRTFVNNGIVFSSDEFSRITGIDNLGTYNRKYRKIFGSGIDKRIDKKSNDYTDEFDEVIDKKIILGLKEKIGEEKNVLILGKNEDAKIDKVISLLSDSFEDIKFTKSRETKETLNNIEKILNNDAVILVSEREKTGLSDLVDSIRLAKKYNKKILGNIIF